MSSLSLCTKPLQDSAAASDKMHSLSWEEDLIGLSQTNMSKETVMSSKLLKDMCVGHIGGTLTKKGSMGMCGSEDNLFTSLPWFARVLFQAKELKSQFTRPPFWEKFGNFSLYCLNFCPNFSSQAPKFGHFQTTRPLFQRQNSVCKPHTLKIQATHPYLKKKLSAFPHSWGHAKIL